MGIGGTKKTYNRREIRKILKANGFVYDRTSGDHDIYKKNGRHVSIPYNTNKMLWQRLVKENGIII